MREPIGLLGSTFNYIQDAAAFKKSGSLEQFLENPKYFYENEEPDEELSRMNLEHAHFAHNHMAFDLGYSANNVPPAEIGNILEETENFYDLVMLQDRFDESLILLKEKFCWEMEDVLFLVQNRNNDSDQKNSDQKSSSQIFSKLRSKRSKLTDSLSDSQKQKIKNWNQVDTALYNHFATVLDSKIEKFGVLRMEREVEKLRAENDKIHKKCISGTEIQTKSTKFSFVPKNSKIVRYRLKSSMKHDPLCNNLVRSSLNFLHLLRLRSF